jgi:hypothetical protein
LRIPEGAKQRPLSYTKTLNHPLGFLCKRVACFWDHTLLRTGQNMLRPCTA